MPREEIDGRSGRKQVLGLLQWVGGALALLGVIFVGFRLSEYAGQIDIAGLGTSDWIALAGLSAVYGVANVLLALAWRNLLAFSGERTNIRWALRTYGISQLAKYVPGNIAHFLGRQAIGVSAGLGGWPMARSALWELGLLCVVAALFGLLAAPFIFSVPPLVAVAVFVAGIAIGVVAARRIFGHLVATALIQQAIFLGVSGAVFVGTVGITTPWTLATLSWPSICGAYILAWLAGLVTPGAPAGVGVREAVLLFLFHDAIAPADLLLAIIAARLVSVVGDCLFFGAAWAIRSAGPANKRPA